MINYSEIYLVYALRVDKTAHCSGSSSGFSEWPLYNMGALTLIRWDTWQSRKFSISSKSFSKHLITCGYCIPRSDFMLLKTVMPVFVKVALQKTICYNSLNFRTFYIFCYISCRGSSAGRAADWKSACPQFDSGPRHHCEQNFYKADWLYPAEVAE